MPLDLSRPRVLVAEDDPALRRLWEKALLRSGCAVHTASDGQEAWRIFQRESFDWVWTDWRMPGWDGLRLSAQVLKRRPRVWVILLSGELEPASEGRFRRSRTRYALQKLEALGELPKILKSWRDQR